MAINTHTEQKHTRRTNARREEHTSNNTHKKNTQNSTQRKTHAANNTQKKNTQKKHTETNT